MKITESDISSVTLNFQRIEHRYMNMNNEHIDAVKAIEILSVICDTHRILNGVK